MEARFQMTTERKWPTASQMVTWPMMSRDPERSNSWPQYTYTPISRKQLKMLFSNSCKWLSGRSLLWGSTVGFF